LLTKGSFFSVFLSGIDKNKIKISDFNVAKFVEKKEIHQIFSPTHKIEMMTPTGSENKLEKLKKN